MLLHLEDSVVTIPISPNAATIAIIANPVSKISIFSFEDSKKLQVFMTRTSGPRMIGVIERPTRMNSFAFAVYLTVEQIIKKLKPNEAMLSTVRIVSPISTSESLI